MQNTHLNYKSIIIILSAFAIFIAVSLLYADDFICADANSDGLVNVSDAVYIVNFVFVGGPAPVPLEAGDANLDGSVNVSDAVTIVNYIFQGSPICVSEDFTITYFDGCKTQGKVDTLPLNMDCIVLDYNAYQTLSIRHYNTVFNCCPVDPYAEVIIDDMTNTIYVNEYENGQCYCMCIFDIFYEIPNLPPDEYTIIVSECWPQNTDHTYTIDLNTTPYDSICIERSGYPYPE